jgi:hypothetical protein
MYTFVDEKLKYILFLGNHEDFQATKRSLKPSKENIQHFKT